MLKEKRRRQILELLRRDGEVSISGLSRDFGVSEMTIRRDLDSMAEDALVMRTHGGAVLSDTPVCKKEEQQLPAEEKLAVARKALAYIPDGTTVFIDSGPTGLLIAKSLPASRHISVITNSIPVAVELVERPFISVMVIGGELKPGELSCRGPAAEDALGRFRMDLAFVDIGAVGRGGELFAGSVAEAGFKKRILAASDQCIALADSSKLGRQSLCRFADLSEVSVIITDDGIAPEQMGVLSDSGVEVVVAQTGRHRPLHG